MKGALIIFIAMVAIGIVLYITDLIFYRKKRDAASPEADAAGDSASAAESGMDESAGEEEEECCGAHLVCEKTSLSPVTGEIVYFDDEELDRFRGRDADDYSPEEVEEFRDVLLTLLPQDVAGWSRSIQVRGIILPTEVRDELLMIVGELRTPSAKN